MSIQLEPEILNTDGVMKIRILARDDKGQIIDADVIVVESALSRQRLAKRLAEKTGEKAEAIEQMLLDLLAVKLRPPPPQPDSAILLEQTSPEIRHEALTRLRDPDLFEWIAADIKMLGVTGDEVVGLAVYVVGTSRVLDKPLSCIFQGASSAGKSYVVASVAQLFPPEVKLLAHHLSSKALYYLPEDALKHRLVVAGERARRQDDEQADSTKALREMISDGVLRSAVTEIVDGKPQTFTYEKQGPIAYIETTSASTIFAEDANRCLVLHVDESEAQTKAIVTAAANAASKPSIDAAEKIVIPLHHTMQRMLRPCAVVIPYAPLLAQRFPTRRVEARRAMPHLLNSIRAIALLRQYQKEMKDGVIVADAVDYAQALRIVGPTLAHLRGGIDEHVKRVWAAIVAHAAGDAEFTREQAAGWSGVRQGDANGRLRLLAELGFITETVEHRGNRPAKFKINPEAGDIEQADDEADLPTVEEVATYV